MCFKKIKGNIMKKLRANCFLIRTAHSPRHLERADTFNHQEMHKYRAQGEKGHTAL